MSIAHFPNKDITSKLSLAAITKNPLTEVSISLWAQLPVVRASQSRTAFTFIDSSNASAIALRFTTKGIFELDIHGSLRMLHGPPVVDGKWHHYGITWRSNDGHVEIHADGILRLSQTGFATGHTLPAGGTMVLGQSYRVLNGALNQDSDLNFHGNLTSVNIWSRLLGGLSMAALSKGTGLESGDVISWKNLAKEDNKMGNVTLQAHDDIRSPVRSVDFYLDFGAVKSTSNYGRFPGTFPDLEAFTLSIWVNRPKAEESGLVAYSIPGVPDYFGLYHKSDTLSISLLNKWLYFPITPFAANGWVWFGWQWRKSDGRTLCYIGDTLVKNGTYEVGSTMQGGGILILGHELDAHGGGFQTSQVLTGHMSHFNVWSVFLDNSDLMALHRGGDAFEGDVVPWSIFRSTGSYFGAIKVVEYSPCTSQTASVMALRSSWCEKFINAVGPFVTLCDRRPTIKTRLLRCYIAGSLQKDANGLFWSDEGSLLYTRNEELRIIHD
ncbi:neuronal pentraxin-2 [Nematostella vectensis]|nr:neuronal pentraxin-2 [Nematostella vectensis]